MPLRSIEFFEKKLIEMAAWQPIFFKLNRGSISAVSEIIKKIRLDKVVFLY